MNAILQKNPLNRYEFDEFSRKVLIIRGNSSNSCPFSQIGYTLVAFLHLITHVCNNLNIYK
jgi:hypothetical protein